MEGDGVHIALGKNDPSQPGLLGDVECEKIAALVIDNGIRRVEIFGRAIVQHPAAKPDDVAPDINDGKHHPAPEAVVNPPLLAVHRQACVQHVPFIIALFSHGGHQVIPAIGGHAQAKALHRSPGQSPPSK